MLFCFGHGQIGIDCQAESYKMLFVYQLALREQKEEDCGNVDAREQDPRPNALALLFAAKASARRQRLPPNGLPSMDTDQCYGAPKAHGIRFGDTTHGSGEGWNCPRTP